MSAPSAVTDFSPNLHRKEEKKMILKFAIQTVFEILLVVGIIYGFIHEDKLIAFEDKLAEKFKKR